MIVNAIEERLTELRQLSDLAQQIEDAGLDREFTFTWASGRLILYIYDIRDLSVVRRRLREALGHWEDKFWLAWASEDRALAEWRGRRDPIGIWLCVPPEQFPQELLSEGCTFQKNARTHYELMCNRSTDG